MKVIRLVGRSTVEEIILRRAEHKLRLTHNVMTSTHNVMTSTTDKTADDNDDDDCDNDHHMKVDLLITPRGFSNIKVKSRMHTRPTGGISTRW